MFWGSAYLFAIIKYFSFAFFVFTPFATQLFSTAVMSSIKPPQPSSAIYGAPPFTGNQIYHARWSLENLILTIFRLFLRPENDTNHGVFQSNQPNIY